MEAPDPVWEVRRMSEEEPRSQVQILAPPYGAPSLLNQSPWVLQAGDSLAAERECHVAPSRDRVATVSL